MMSIRRLNCQSTSKVNLASNVKLNFYLDFKMSPIIRSIVHAYSKIGFHLIWRYTFQAHSLSMYLYKYK